MSLSVARPIVVAPLGFCSAPDREGSNAWNIFVARFATSGGLAAAGDIWVCGAACEDPTLDICCGWGWKLGGGGGALVGYAGGRPPPLMGYTGCPGGPGGWGGPGCGRRNGGAAQVGGRPKGPGGAASGGPG